jgi:hypothetical protein
MHLVLAAAAVVALLGAAAACGAGFSARRFLSPLARLTTYRLLLAASLIPCGMLISYVARYTARSGSLPLGIESFGYYPGVVAYVGFSAALVVGMLLFATWLASRTPMLSGLLPAAAFIAHRLAIDLLNWEAPGGRASPIDNVAFVWFFVVSAGATVFLLVFSRLGLAGERRAA